MKNNYLWKFLLKNNKSQHGNCVWKKNVWKKHRGSLGICSSGFHASKKIIDAFSYVNGEVLAKVEVDGLHIKQEDKQVWSEMRALKLYSWTKEDSIKLSIYSAELCLENYEKLYPDDDRVRKAIEAAKFYLENPTEAARLAAESARLAAESAAWSAESAWSARSAAWSAAWSARSAAESARSAARLAAESARLAAESAAWSARSAALDKIELWLQNHVKNLKEIK